MQFQSSLRASLGLVWTVKFNNIYRKLSCCREAAWCPLSLKILLSYSRSCEITALDRAHASSLASIIQSCGFLSNRDHQCNILASQTAATRVCRRLPGLPQHASQERSHHSRPSLHLCYRHQRLADGKPTRIKPYQDPGYVAGFKPAAGQDRHKRSAAVIIPCKSSIQLATLTADLDRSWPSTVVGRTCHGCL